MCIKFYEIGKSKKGILRRVLKMCLLITIIWKRMKISFVHLLSRNDHPSCTKRLALQDGARVLFSSARR